MPLYNDIKELLVKTHDITAKITQNFQYKLVLALSFNPGKARCSPTSEGATYQKHWGENNKNARENPTVYGR